MGVGIEAINAYVGRASLGVRELFEVRGLDQSRIANLMMERKSVNLPIEDPVTNAVNAAKPIVDMLCDEERDQIELVIVGTESGLDFAKPISTYAAQYLGLPRRCRSFEVKHACYGGTAALQMAVGVVRSSPFANVKALVIAADAASAAARNTYWEPSQGAGAVAMLVGSSPSILDIDHGASGYCSYQVMDTLRPRPDLEAGDTDLSVMSYMTCLEESLAHYAERVEGADLMETFDYLVLHTPFAGIVKGAHRRLMRRARGMSAEAIDSDFDRRAAPSLRYCSQVGNVYSAALYLGLCALIDHAPIDSPRRIGLFSYGSGCASEFYSGVVSADAKQLLAEREISEAVKDRYELSLPEYEVLSDLSFGRMAGVQDLEPDVSPYAHIVEKKFNGEGLLVLAGIKNFQRSYRWS